MSPGAYLFEVTHPTIGSQSRPITIGSGGVVEVERRLSRDGVVLEPLVVTAEPQLRAPRTNGFYDRERMGFGTFFSAEEVLARVGAGIRVSDAVQDIRGIAVRGTGSTGIYGFAPNALVVPASCPSTSTGSGHPRARSTS